MIYKEITIYTTTEAADLVADIFFSQGGSGVCIHDKNDLAELYKTNVIWDYIDENIISQNDGIVSVKGFVPSDCFKEKMQVIQSELEFLKQNSVFNTGSLEITVRDVNDTDWYEIWKQRYKPININNITICPVWSSEKPNNMYTVYIDPGMAFGTGEHETTAMCLSLMQDYPLKDKTVIDIGCGSGILGTAAAVCGAKNVYMSDIDPIAITAATNCIKLNKVQHIASVSQNTPENIKGDMILLNIVADVLISYTQTVAELSVSGTAVILSGIIHSRLRDVEKAYNTNGFKTIKKVTEGEWNALSLVKE